ncbi:MAG: glycosyltransferase [Nitrosomonadales bacterium]|nr:glycosyltransferase [Nitrosomonadales bacterium]
MNATGTSGLVSVVVPSYNYARYLDQRMASLLNQTYRNLEILAIDDCSTDDSVEVLRKYESRPQFKLVVREKNGGWVVVNNQGVEMTSGEYILFAQCDDDCDPRMVERLVGAMDANPGAGIAFCRSLLVDEQERVMGDDFAVRERAFRDKCGNDTLITGAEMGRFLLHSCVIPNLSAVLIRRECFNTVGNFTSSYRVSGDWDWFFRIAAHYGFAYVAEPLNRFRQHQTTIRSSTKARVVYEEYFRLLLNQIRSLELTFAERCRFRTRVMYLWGVHLFSQPWSALRNFPYHLGRVLQLDPYALIFLTPALILCIFRIVEKACNRTAPVGSA